MTRIGTDLQYAKELLQKNELVAIPTETVYGLAANGLNADAVLKIYEAKNRPSFNPLILHTDSIANAKKLVSYFSPLATRLAESFMPGPLTLVLPKAAIVPDIVTAGLDTVGIRIPRHPLTLQLLSMLDFPLAAPSANPSGYVSATTPAHVAAQLGNQLTYILDGGICEIGIESTIVKVEDDSLTILRQGGIAMETIAQVAGKNIRLHQPASGAKPESPGMLLTHYAPKTPMVVGSIAENAKKYVGKKTGVLWFQTPNVKVEAEREMVLSPSGNLHEAARNLFSYLRLMDAAELEIILAEPAPDTGLGVAINDRLCRAGI